MARSRNRSADGRSQGDSEAPPSFLQKGSQRPKRHSFSPALDRLSSESERQDDEPVADSASHNVATPPPAPVANGTPVSSSPPSSKPSSPFVERSNPMGAGNAQTVSSKDPKAVAQAATDMKNVVRRKLTGYVGFANLPNQWHRKSVRKGFNFNVMVVGKCPTGGTTQSCNLFNLIRH